MTAPSHSRPGKQLTRRGLLAGVGATTGLLALGACSDTDPFAVDQASGGYSGGPIITGSQQYYSNEIIAELYAQMMEKTGLTVTRQYQIGQREVYLPELEAGKILGVHHPPLRPQGPQGRLRGRRLRHAGGGLRWASDRQGPH